MKVMTNRKQQGSPQVSIGYLETSWNILKPYLVAYCQETILPQCFGLHATTRLKKHLWTLTEKWGHAWHGKNQDRFVLIDIGQWPFVSANKCWACDVLLQITWTTPNPKATILPGASSTFLAAKPKRRINLWNSRHRDVGRPWMLEGQWKKHIWYSNQQMIIDLILYISYIIYIIHIIHIIYMCVYEQNNIWMCLLKNGGKRCQAALGVSVARPVPRWSKTRGLGTSTLAMGDGTKGWWCSNNHM